LDLLFTWLLECKATRQTLVKVHLTFPGKWISRRIHIATYVWRSSCCSKDLRHAHVDRPPSPEIFREVGILGRDRASGSAGIQRIYHRVHWWRDMEISTAFWVPGIPFILDRTQWTM
jgi:hypothetical protein